MALFSKTELAHALGVGKSTISNKLTRKPIQLFSDEHGLINDQDERNTKYIEKALKKIGGNYKPPSEIAKSITEAKLTRREKALAPPPPKKKKSEEDLDIRKKRAEVEWKEGQTRLNELKEAKLKGENIPYKLVESIIIMLASSILTEHKDSSENLLGQLAHECKISAKMHAKYKDLQIKSINSAQTSAIDITIKELKAIADSEAGKIITENE